MKPITTANIEIFNHKKHKSVLIYDLKRGSCLVVAEGLNKIIKSPNFKSDHFDSKHFNYEISQFDAKFLRVCEETAGYSLAHITQEDLRDLSLIIVSSCTELEFADTFKQWVAAKLREQTTITITE